MPDVTDLPDVLRSNEPEVAVVAMYVSTAGVDNAEFLMSRPVYQSVFKPGKWQAGERIAESQPHPMHRQGLRKLQRPFCQISASDLDAMFVLNVSQGVAPFLVGTRFCHAQNCSCMTEMISRGSIFDLASALSRQARASRRPWVACLVQRRRTCPATCCSAQTC